MAAIRMSTSGGIRINPIEGAWKETKKRTTHNRFFKGTYDSDMALCATFEMFVARPSLLAGQVARFL